VNAIGIAWLILIPAALGYFLLWRPQQRRMASVRRLQAELSQNDDVMTTSGIYGRVTRLGDEDLDLEIAPGIVIRVARGAVALRCVDQPSDQESRDPENEAD
jgi:preprotein translocase subunit YajC